MAKVRVFRQKVDKDNQLRWNLVEVDEAELLPHEVAYDDLPIWDLPEHFHPPVPRRPRPPEADVSQRPG